jgi:hypothetical protein
MIETDNHLATPEARSTVKISLNAKQDPQWEIKVVEGADPVELDRIRELAVAQHRALVRELLGGR